MTICFANVIAGPFNKVVTSKSIAEKIITILTTSKSSSWAPKEIVNTRETLIWNVSGGLTIGKHRVNGTTFDLSKNTGMEIITIGSGTDFIGLTRIKISKLNIVDVDFAEAKDLIVLRSWDNQLKTFKVEPSMQWLIVNDNALTSSALDGIV